ncbi:hypothetical protein GCM10023318_46660 [Nocardia callitridis]|uniref:Uncharacterized protein n=1 Tax=Nocardia callitridis TaxID=648753 RepID=A0ABP9KPF4_9NOCA
MPGTVRSPVSGSGSTVFVDVSGPADAVSVTPVVRPVAAGITASLIVPTLLVGTAVLIVRTCLVWASALSYRRVT